jgi:hypothetical protein
MLTHIIYLVLSLYLSVFGQTESRVICANVSIDNVNSIAKIGYDAYVISLDNTNELTLVQGCETNQYNAVGISQDDIYHVDF